MHRTLYGWLIFVTIISAQLFCAACFDQEFAENSTSYLFGHGLFSSESQMAKYCPKFVASTGELVLGVRGGHVIGNQCSSATFSEIVLDKPSFSRNPLSWPLYAVRKCAGLMMCYLMKGCYGVTVVEDENVSKTVAQYWFDVGKLNIGQIPDIASLSAAYSRHVERYPDTHIILYGVSRGAAAAYNFLMQQRPQNVKAAVLEGVFDDIPHLLKHFGQKVSGNCTERGFRGLLRVAAREYNPQGPFPSQYMDGFKEVPLLLVTSLGDWQVPYQCTMRLYRKLREHGYEKVHLLVLNDVGHLDYMVGDTEDRRRYEAVVHRFYQEYGLAYNEAQAAAGETWFLQTSPSIDELYEKYHLLGNCCTA